MFQKHIKCIHNSQYCQYTDIYETNCVNKSKEISDLEEQCDVLSTYAVYDGSSYDPNTNVWVDISGQCRNIDDYMINGDITIHEQMLNNQTYISGTTTTNIVFPVDVLPHTYVFIYIYIYICFSLSIQ